MAFREVRTSADSGFSERHGGRSLQFHSPEPLLTPNPIAGEKDQQALEKSQPAQSSAQAAVLLGQKSSARGEVQVEMLGKHAEHVLVAIDDLGADFAAANNRQLAPAQQAMRFGRAAGDERGLHE